MDMYLITKRNGKQFFVNFKFIERIAEKKCSDGSFNLVVKFNSWYK